MGACDLSLKNKNKNYQNKIKFISRFNENPQTANPAVVCQFNFSTEREDKKRGKIRF